MNFLVIGSNSFSALGLTNVEVSMKKISKRNTISVIEDILKFALILFLLLSAIKRCGVKDLETLLFLLLK